MKRIIVMVWAMALLVLVANAQQTNLKQKITISNPIISGHDLLDKLTKETGYRFLYSESIISIPPKVKLQQKKGSLIYFLDAIFKGQNVDYVIKGQKVFIKPSISKPSIQKSIKLTGKVIDETTNESIPYANIRIENQAHGVVSNMDGDFEFHIPAKYQNLNTIVSFMGYESEIIEHSTLENTSDLIIKLKPKVFLMEEVVIKPPDALEIFNSAISKIPDNYSTDAVYFDAYYRELVKVDTAFVKYSDAACKFYYSGYNQPYDEKKARKAFNDYSGFNPNNSRAFPKAYDEVPHPFDKVKIIEARASDNLQQFEDDWGIEEILSNFDIGGGPISITACDKVKHLTDFLDPDNAKSYIFNVEDYSEYNGHPIYIISFKPKRNKAVWEGKMYIDRHTHAFVAFEYNVSEAHQKYIEKSYAETHIIFGKTKREKVGRRVVKGKTRPYQHKVRVDYIPYNGKWYLNRIKTTNYYKSTGNFLADSKHETYTELVINSIETDNVKPFEKKEAFKGIVSNFLFQYPLTYNSGFWNNYNAIIPTGIFGKALKDLERERGLDKQFKSKVQQDTNLQAPVAEKIPHITYIHDDTLVDNYFWLKNRDNKAVKEYIRQENQYTDNYMIPLRKKQRDLYYEMVDRIEKDIETIPRKIDNYYYFERYKEGCQHEIICRKKDTLNATEEVVLDINKLAKENPYFSVEQIAMSSNHTIVAYTENTSGGFENMVRFKDLAADSLIKDSLMNIADIVWANDNKTLFYTKMDSTYRSYKVYKHILGTSEMSDKLVFEEKDNTFYVNLKKSKSKKYIFIHTFSSNESETLYALADDPEEPFKYIQKRITNHKYSVSHYKNNFYILTNKDAINFKMVSTPVDKTGIDNWEVVIPHKENRMLTNFEIFNDFLVIEEQENLESRIRVIQWQNKEEHVISFDEKIHTVSLGHNPTFATHKLRVNYTSLVTPDIVYDYDMQTKQKDIVKQEKVLGHYDPKVYKVERHFATASDGTEIPITLIYKKNWKQVNIANGSRKKDERKLYLWAYGSYGLGSYPQFSSSDISLLNRGYTIAIAHIRGGDDLGQQWYEDGKLLNKKNTFTDFIACAEYLTEKGYAKKGEIAAWGGSAGGMLMGAVANERPDLFKALILDVPFVDVLNTMLDEKRPLTTGEYKEWGNPKEGKYYDYIKSYSPYDNIKKQNYPAMLFVAYMNDDNAPYWEAAKTVAKLREMNTGDNEILLKVYNVGGHAGGSGRFDNLKDQSLQFTFIMNVLE